MEEEEVRDLKSCRSPDSSPRSPLLLMQWISRRMFQCCPSPHAGASRSASAGPSGETDCASLQHTCAIRMDLNLRHTCSKSLLMMDSRDVTPLRLSGAPSSQVGVRRWFMVDAKKLGCDNDKSSLIANPKHTQQLTQPPSYLDATSKFNLKAQFFIFLPRTNYALRSDISNIRVLVDA